MLPQDARRAALLRGATWLAPRPDRPAPKASAGLAVGGELDRPSGLGEGARLLLAACTTLGVPAWPVRPGGPVPPEGAPLVLHGNPVSLPSELIRLKRAQISGRRVIGYWPWELPVVPDAWRRGVGFVHEVWAPSRFTADALASLVPDVRVVPYPVAVRPPAPSALGRAAFGLPDDAVVTLVRFSLASSFERKNPLGALAAHRAAFGDRPDRILLLHVTNPTHFPADFARIQAASGTNVRIATDALSRADAEAMLAACDIVLSLHRSEGFGLVPAEAMMMSKPVVATDWSANTEFMDSSCAAMVPMRLIEARDDRGIYAMPGAVWADPDIEAAAAWLQRLADDPALRTRLGQAGQAAAEARLGPSALADALRALGLAALADALRAPGRAV